MEGKTLDIEQVYKQEIAVMQEQLHALQMRIKELTEELKECREDKSRLEEF